MTRLSLLALGLALLLTACPSTSAPPNPGDKPALAGTLHVPTGSDVRGVVVVACLPSGTACDEERSRTYEVTTAGRQAAYRIDNLANETYVLFAVKDVNANGVLGDEGDLFGFYGEDGVVEAPADDLVITLRVVAEVPGPHPEPYSVAGVALDGQGNPIPHALVQVIPAVTTGLIEVRTDRHGHYAVTSLPNVPYYVYAFTEVAYNDQTFCLRLAQDDYSTFLPAQGVTRNFHFQLTGPIGDLPGRYFGGTLRVYKFGAYANHGKAIEFAFTATGRRIDGSEGSSFTYTAPLGSPDHLYIHDIPVGPYMLTATLVGFDDQRSAIAMGPDIFETPYTQVLMDWHAVGGCYAANGIHDNYVWLESPGP